MAKVLVVTSGKGGVGKTTCASAFALAISTPLRRDRSAGRGCGRNRHVATRARHVVERVGGSDDHTVRSEIAFEDKLELFDA